MTLSTSAVAVCCCSDFAQLVEQAGVLDSDDGLSGEIGDQLDLLVGEWPDLLAVDADRADQLVLLEHRHDEQGAGAAEVDDGDRQRIALEVGRIARCRRYAASASSDDAAERIWDAGRRIPARR